MTHLRSSLSIVRTDEKVEKVGKIINKDRGRPMPEITGRLGLSYGICQWTVGEGLNVWKIRARFVHRMLTNEAQQREFFGARAWLLSPTSLLASCPATRTSFPERSLNSRAIAENSKKSVPFVLPAVAETL